MAETRARRRAPGSVPARRPYRFVIPLLLVVLMALAFRVYWERSPGMPPPAPPMDDSAAELPLSPPPLPSDNADKLRAMRADMDALTARGGPDDLARAAMLARRMGNVWREEKLLRAALKARPGDRTARLWLADAMVQQARFPEARTLYLKLLGESRNDTRVFLGLSNLAISSGSRAEAWDWLARGVEEGPQTADSLTYLGRRYQDWNDFGRAKAALEKAMRLAPNDPNPQLGLASLLLQNGEVDESRRMLETLVRTHPEDGSACRLLASALIVPTDPHPSFPRARLLLERAAELNPKDPDVYRLAGIVYMNLKLYRLAAQTLDALLTLDPASTDARYNLGQAYARLGKMDLSRQQIACYERLRAPTRRITLVAAACGDHPTDPDRHVEFGKMLEANGDLGGALREYQVACGLAPRNAKARAALGKVYARLGWGKPEASPR